jgi:hypothetical protein
MQLSDQTPLTTDDLRPLLDQAITQLGLAQLALSLLTLKVQAVMGVEVAVTRRTMTTPVTPMTPIAQPTCDLLGGWPEVPEDTCWPLVVGPEAWTSTHKGYSKSLPAPSPTVWLTSSNTTSTYRPSSEPSKPGKTSWKNTWSKQTDAWEQPPPARLPKDRGRGRWKKTEKTPRAKSTESEHARMHVCFCHRSICRYHNEE